MTSADAADRELVDRLVRRRDNRAFAQLYATHSASMYRLALRLTAGDEPQSEDLVHDAWIHAIQRLATFQWRSTLRTWLAGFVMNLWRESVRHTGREVEFDEDKFSDDGAAWQQTFSRIDIERGLAALSPGYREVLVLHDIEGYTHEEIASLLGVEPGTSKSQLSRARAALRRSFAEKIQGRTNV